MGRYFVHGIIKIKLRSDDSGLFFAPNDGGFFYCKSVENNGGRMLYNSDEVISVLKIPTDSEQEKRMPAGGYVCRIVKATSGVNRYDEPCLLLYLDVAEGEFKNYFGRIYERRLAHGEETYPCVYRQRAGSYSKKYFDQLIETIEASNDDYVYSGRDGEDWDERELEKLLIGVVFQEKEFFNARDKRRVILVPYALKTVDEIRRGEFTTPAVRYA